MKLIVGLGNPGREYEKTRHNAGFDAIDRLADRYGLRGGKSKFHGMVVESMIEGEKCVLLKPMTYMNRSGLSVGEAASFYKLQPQDVLILVDDVALPVGTIRLRAEGGAGGHNGLLDIERALGTRSYVRLRIGIDPPGRARQVDYVLARFSKDQREALDPALEAACDAIERWIREGVDKAMSLSNARP